MDATRGRLGTRRPHVAAPRQGRQQLERGVGVLGVLGQRLGEAADVPAFSSKSEQAEHVEGRVGAPDVLGQQGRVAARERAGAPVALVADVVLEELDRRAERGDARLGFRGDLVAVAAVQQRNLRVAEFARRLCNTCRAPRRPWRTPPRRRSDASALSVSSSAPRSSPSSSSARCASTASTTAARCSLPGSPRLALSLPSGSAAAKASSATPAAAASTFWLRRLAGDVAGERAVLVRH